MADKAPSSEARAAAQRRFLEIAHELDVPEIDWDLWPQECTSDAHNTVGAVKTD